MERKGDVVTFVQYIVNKHAIWDKPWEFTFGFSPTPVKPINKNYRSLSTWMYDYKPAKGSDKANMQVQQLPLGEYYEYWSKYCNSFRANIDAVGVWDNFMTIYPTYLKYYHFVNKGHYFDMDMLDIGTSRSGFVHNALSEDEQIVAVSTRAFFNSPIQISSTLENLSDFELSLYCNDEIIAINQDEAFYVATPIYMNEKNGSMVHIYEKLLSDGSYAYAIFNLGVKGEFIRMTFEGETLLRDAWAKEDMGIYGELEMPIAPHSVRIIKSQKKRKGIECIY